MAFTLAIGAAAPDFELPGADGRNYRLADFSKAKVLVVESQVWPVNWINRERAENGTMALEDGEVAHLAYRLDGGARRIHHSEVPPRFEGGSEAWHLSDCAYVTLRNIAVRGQSGNGINIDDGGSYDSPARHVVLRNVSFSRIGNGGNNDCPAEQGHPWPGRGRHRSTSCRRRTGRTARTPTGA